MNPSNSIPFLLLRLSFHVQSIDTRKGRPCRKLVGVK
jgi:hypothetical protein